MAEKPAEQRRNAAAWKVQKHGRQMSMRYDFSNYDETSDFLGQLEILSEKEAYYPDLTFSRTHVNVSITAREGELTQIDFDFSEKVDALTSGTNT